MPWLIQCACSGEGDKVAKYHLLNTAIDLDGLYDLLEMKIVDDSWADAAWLNMKESHE